MAEDKDGWELGDCWFKTTDKKGGVTYTAHRCWNVSRFAKKHFARVLMEVGVAEQITEAQFIAATRNRRDQSSKPGQTPPRKRK